MGETVLTETSDRVCTITLNRPEARNAMNSELQRALAIALAGAEADDGVDVVILTGADPAFCSGLDLRELGTTAANLVGGRDDEIGAINGPAVTGGFELALGCDFLVASERATFGDTHTRVGVNLKQLSDRGSKLSVGDAIALEQQRFRNFRVDPSEIERRRTAVVQRGRGQTK